MLIWREKVDNAISMMNAMHPATKNRLSGVGFIGCKYEEKECEKKERKRHNQLTSVCVWVI